MNERFYSTKPVKAWLMQWQKNLAHAFSTLNPSAKHQTIHRNIGKKGVSKEKEGGKLVYKKKQKIINTKITQSCSKKWQC